MPFTLPCHPRDKPISQIYQLDHNQWDTKGFAWAGGFGPLPGGMPFLHPTELKMSNAFWHMNPMPPGVTIDRGARAWPDLLGHGGGSPSFFASERVLNDLRSIDAPIARVTEMPIAEINARALKSKPAPRYFVIETIPGIEVDLIATGFRVDAAGRAILDPPPKPSPWPYRYRASSWNGTDLFAYRHFGPTNGPYTDLFCTERVKELAEREGWTNVRFKPLPAI